MNHHNKLKQHNSWHHDNIYCTESDISLRHVAEKSKHAWTGKRLWRVNHIVAFREWSSLRPIICDGLGRKTRHISESQRGVCDIFAECSKKSEANWSIFISIRRIRLFFRAETKRTGNKNARGHEERTASDDYHYRESVDNWRLRNPKEFGWSEWFQIVLKGINSKSEFTHIHHITKDVANDVQWNSVITYLVQWFPNSL